MAERITLPSIDILFDELTANCYADHEYYTLQPTFSEFAAIHEKLVLEFGHSALVGDWVVNPVMDHPDDTTTDKLVEQWEKVSSWYDVADYMDEWVWKRIKREATLDQ